MTAGSGILHQEMPQGDPRGRMHGFQLWANLPSSLKMTAPRYQDVAAAEIPEIVDDDDTRVRVVCGEFWAAWHGNDGPIRCWEVQRDEDEIAVIRDAARRGWEIVNSIREA